MLAVPRRPAHGVAVGRERTPAAHRSSVPSSASDLGHVSRADVPAANVQRYRADVIDVEDAQRTCSRPARRWRPSTTALDDAVGLVLAADVVAGEDVPPFDNTAVDGYAVRAADLARRAGRAAASSASWPPARRPRRRARAGRGDPDHDRRADAGRRRRGRDGRGQRARLDGDRVRSSAVGRGRASPCAAPATTCEPATCVFAAGTRRRRRPSPACWPASTPGACRCTRRPVSPCCRPATSWSTTARPLRPGQIRESNRRCSPPLLAEAGCVVVDLGIVARRRGRARGRAARRGRRRCDAIVTSGGVSMGDYDVVKAVLGRIADMHVDADRHQAGQAVRLRARSTARRSSACPATRSARW